jgi:serine/threonine protein kinase
VYSLGVIFYLVLTGEKPFSGDTAFDLARQILQGEPVRIETLQPRIPADLSSLVGVMISKAPNKRPSPGEVLTRIKKIEQALIS